MGPRIAAFVALIAAAVAPAHAVKPGEWVFATEADFQKAEVDHTVVTNLGKVKLSRAVELVAELEAENAIVYDLAKTLDGQVFMAIGPVGKLARLVDDKIELISEFEGEQVFAMTTAGNTIWLGISGANSRIERRNADKPGEVVQAVPLKDVRYVWDIVRVGLKFAVATGTDGKVLVVDPKEPEAEPIVALDTEQSNVLCLAESNGRIFAGTDGEGLVYRLSPTGDEDEPYQSFIVYDAAEPEIGALHVNGAGVVYVGTADAEQARTGRLADAVEEETGEPDTDADTDEASTDEAAAPAAEPDGPDAAAPADDPAEVADAKPTAEQYDELREAIKQRLADAARGKQWSAGTGSGSGKPGRRADTGRSNGGKDSKDGNAVYAIDTDGFVRTIFRESVMVLNITEHNGKLIITTGNEGEVYRVDPATEEVTVIADLDAQQIPAVLVLNGTALIGTANPGQVHHAVEGFAKEGTYTSDPRDAEQISQWGKLNIVAELPDGTSLSVQTRSGNAEDPEAGSWSNWSNAQPITVSSEGAPVYVDVTSPPARFMQFRLTLGSDGTATPTIQRVAMKYVTPNMKPKIKSIKAEYPSKGKGKDEGKPKTTVKVEWEAEDANGDELTFTLEARKLGDGSPFVELDAEIEDTSYEWDTRSMPDGRYEVRLVASDAKDNVPSQAMQSRRLTAQLVIDNSPPSIQGLTVTAAGAGSVKLTVAGVDSLNQVTEVRYAINGAKDWQPLLPQDLIYDSTSESVESIIRDLAPGRSVVSVRVTDAQGNSSYRSATVMVPGE